MLFQRSSCQFKAHGKNPQVWQESKEQFYTVVKFFTHHENRHYHHAPWKEMSFEISSWYCEGNEYFLLKCLGTLLRKLCKYSTVLSDLWSVRDHIDHTVAAWGSIQRVTKHLYMTCMIKCAGIIFWFSKS